jgi:hypothetical protein
MQAYPIIAKVLVLIVNKFRCSPGALPQDRRGMIRPVLVILPLLLFLTACQSDALRRPEALLFEQLAGGQFTLHRDITINPGRVRVIFQQGTASPGATELQPRCELEVRRILETPQTIPAGSYRIGKVRGMQRFVKRPTDGVMLAAVGDPVQLADDTSNEWYMHTYIMQLLSEQQEDAPTLVCGGAYNFAFYARYPTLQEMRTALGDYATLTLD